MATETGKFKIEQFRASKNDWISFAKAPLNSLQEAESHMEEVVKFFMATNSGCDEKNVRSRFRIAPVTLEELGKQRYYLHAWDGVPISEAIADPKFPPLPDKGQGWTDQDRGQRYYIDLPAGGDALMNWVQSRGYPVMLFPPSGNDFPYWQIFTTRKTSVNAFR